MWADEGKSWWRIWSGLVQCDHCSALMNSSAPCPLCGRDYSSDALQVPRIVDGKEVLVPQVILQGAIAWSTNVLLALMRSEWSRPTVPEIFSSTPPEKRPSQRMLIVILFWTLFENLMDQFFSAATASLPVGIRTDLLNRYGGIGARMDRLYKLLFNTTLRADMAAIGREGIYEHILLVQERRNSFIHGDPEAIDEGLVVSTVEKLQSVQEAWVALYNLRCAGRGGLPPVWNDGSSPIRQ